MRDTDYGLRTTYGLLLAAGTSSRMGQPKQLLDWHGVPLVRHVAQQALTSKLDGLIIVVGADAGAVQAALVGLEVAITIVVNPDYATGQASSLRAGLHALPPTADAALVLLVDQPHVTPSLINTLVTTLPAESASAGAAPVAVIPRYQGQRGNPVLLTRTLFAELQQVQGDVGARAILQRYAHQIRWLDIDDPAVIQDIDTLEAYQELKKMNRPT